MGHQRSQGKGWIKLKASPGIPLPEDLQDQNGRLLRLEEFPALLGLLCFSCWEYCINLSLSFSKSHTFLKSLLTFQALVVSEVRNYDQWSLTDRQVRKWMPEMTLDPTQLECLYCFFLRGRAGVLRVGLRHQTGEVRILLCGWRMQPRFQKESS